MEVWVKMTYEEYERFKGHNTPKIRIEDALKENGYEYVKHTIKTDPVTDQEFMTVVYKSKDGASEVVMTRYSTKLP